MSDTSEHLDAVPEGQTPPPLSDPIIGALIAQRYQVHHRLARGGMATVYEATDERLDRRVALKVMHPHLAEDTQFIARFDREARSAARINHPAVVTIFDQGFVDGRPFLVMDLVKGPNLRQLLQREGPFTLGDSLRLISDILMALRAAARENVIHRDIKPENVLLSTEGTARVADFGLARAATEASMSMTSNMLGTVTYMAPEIATSHTPDARTDLYSVGIMLFEMLTGHVPWHGENPLSIAYAHVHNDVPAPSTEESWIPREIDDFVATLTARQPDERPATPDEALSLLTRVREALSDELLDKRSPKALEQHSTTTADVDSNGQFPSLHELLATRDLPNHEEKAPVFSQENSNNVSSSDDANQEQTDTATDTSAQLDHTHVLPSLPPGEQPTEFISRDIFQTRIYSQPLVTQPDEDENITPTPTDVATKDEPSSKHEKKQRKPRHLWRWLIVLFLVALISGASYGGYWWWTEHGPGSYLPMPQTDSRPIEDVRVDLDKLGVKYEVVEEFSDDVAKSLVISSNPRSASEVQKYALVRLTVSKGVDLRVVPQLVGVAKDDIEATLTEVGLKLGVVREEWSEEVASGVVISQSVDSGQELRFDSTVDVVVSKGRQPFTVPQLTGLSREDAAVAVKDIPFSLDISEAFSDSVPAGVVISQEPTQGTELFRNDTVKIVVSKGPELIAVPNVRGMGRDQAIATLEEAGFKVQTDTLVGGLFGIAHSTDPAAGKEVPKGSTVTLYLV